MKSKIFFCFMFVIYSCIIAVNNLSYCFCQPLNNTIYIILSRKDLQTLISSGRDDWGKTPEDIFVNALNSCLESNTNQATITVGKDTKAVISIDQNKSKIEQNEYKTIFGEGHNSNTTEDQHLLERSLVDSICTFYGIERKDLIEIRQNKHLISKKKKEISELFDKCSKLIDKKFYEDKITELITKKLIEKQSESTMLIVPDCPPLI